MSACELCGSVKPLVKATVEGVILQVCASCGKYGNLHAPPRILRSQKPLPLWEDPELYIVPEFSLLLKQARERRKMNQEEFSQFLQEREGVVAKWEAGALQPSVEQAQFLQKKLHQVFVKELSVSSLPASTGQRDTLTLGDALKIRKR